MLDKSTGRLRPNRLSVAVSLALASLMAGGAMAQDAQPQAAKSSTTTTTATQDGEITKVIVSTRRSQQSAIERKKNAATAIDSIVADDVGTLPDRNIGEAISRIAGVAIDRGDFGEGTNVSIRGNGPELTRVELDGQGVNSAGGSNMNGGGDGRATEFRQLSSDLIKSVDVVKGSTADMTEGSLGGGVIIKTRTALDFDKPFVSIRAAGSQNNLNKKWDPDLNLIATKKFLDGRLGFLVNASAIRLSNESHQFQVSSNGRDGYMRALDFDNSPEKTFTYHPETVDKSQTAATSPWVSYGTWNASTPLEIVTKSAAAQTKADCYKAFPVLTSSSSELSALSSTNKTNAINARDQEIASCLNQWNDTNPSLMRYFVKRQIDDRKNLDLRADFKVNSKLTVYAKGSYSRRNVDDNFLTYQLGNVAINGSFTDSAAGVRTAIPGTGYYTFPNSYSLVSGKGPISGATANIDPASVVVDANHRVTSFTETNAGVGVDQIRNRMGTNTHYVNLGGTYKDGPLTAEFMAGDMKSNFWRGDMRSSWSYLYGNATVSLQPDGIWSYAVPAGTNLNDWSRIATLLPAGSATQPQYTTSSPQITYSPQLRETGERTAKLDVTYALPDTIPFLTRIKSGFNLRDTTTAAWGSGGYTAATAVGVAGTAGYVPAVVVPGNNVRGSFIGCQDTAGSLATGGVRCNYGLIPTVNSRSYQIVLTPQQFLDAVQGSMYAPATPTQLFNGAKNRPDALIDNWTQIDVAKLFSTIGAPNLNFDCMKTCLGSDGKMYDQPKTAIKERTQAFYLMSDFNIDHVPFLGKTFPFGWEIEGNVGWRYVRTQIHGSGNTTFTSIKITDLFDIHNPDAAAGISSTSITKPTTVHATTHDFLPVYNLAMWVVPDKVVVRYNHGKTVARPGASLLIPSGTCFYDARRTQDGVENQDMYCGTIGNPALQAQTNINHNLSVEWYPNKDTMLTVSAYKQIGKIGPSKVDSVNAVKLFDGTDLKDPVTGVSLTDIPFDIKTYVNDVPSTRTGLEVSTKTAFTFLPWYLRYTGFDANATRQHSSSSKSVYDLLSGEILTPSGVSKYSFNWALWYDDGKWSARIATQVVGAKFSCIAPCGDTLSGYSLNAYPNQSLAYKNPAYNPGPANISDRTSYVDGKISYKFNKNWDFFIEGRNLTNQTQTSSLASSAYADGTPNLQTYYYPGRRITIGLNFRNL